MTAYTTADLPALCLTLSDALDASISTPGGVAHIGASLQGWWVRFEHWSASPHVDHLIRGDTPEEAAAAAMAWLASDCFDQRLIKAGSELKNQMETGVLTVRSWPTNRKSSMRGTL